MFRLQSASKRFFLLIKSRKSIFGTSLLALVMCSGLISPLASAATPDPNITEYPIAAGSTPFGIAPGPDGNVWFTENSTHGAPNKIGKITPSGTVTEYNIPTGGAGARGITAGPDGNMWFTEGNVDKIGKITPSGTITEYQVPNNNDGLRGIVAGPDGNLWFAETFQGKVGKITTSGTVTEYSGPEFDCPWGIVKGPDGNLWYSDECNGGVGKITTGGTATFYNVLGGRTRAIASGPDGNIWFSEWNTQSIGKITTGGTITEYSSPVWVYGLTAGPDGNLYATDNSNTFQKVSLDGNFTDIVLPTSSTSPYGVTTGSDGNVWFVEYNNSSVARYVFATSATENAAPNDGDANNDGTPDSMQPNVTSFVDPVTGKYTVLATSGCINNASASVTSESHNVVSDDNYNYPNGMMNFTLNCATGAAATVHMYFYGLPYSSNMALRKYDSSTKKYATISSAMLKGVTIGGEVATEATYTIKDGGPLDQDGTANGTIVDPAGVATIRTVSAPDTGFGAPSDSGVIVSVLIIAIALLANLGMIVRLRSKA